MRRVQNPLEKISPANREAMKKLGLSAVEAVVITTLLFSCANATTDKVLGEIQENAGVSDSRWPNILDFLNDN